MILRDVSANLDFIIQYLWSVHGLCTSYHEAAPYTDDELKDIAITLVSSACGKTNAEYLEDCEKNRDEKRREYEN